MATTDIASGTAKGLMGFLDFMTEKGYAKPGSISTWKSAAKQVLTTVEGQDFGDLDVRSLEPEEYLSRFENRSVGKYTADSLAAYRSRFRKAVDAYQSYLKDPNWKPAGRGPARRAASDAGSSKKSAGRRAKVEARPAPDERPTSTATPSLMGYPFPLKSGQIAQLHLPMRLDADDAERLTHFIRALVFEQPKQTSPKKSGEE